MREGTCQWCGVYASTHRHHLHKRSTHPELREDERNIAELCPACHGRAHNDRDFLKKLQEVFYGDDRHDT